MTDVCSVFLCMDTVVILIDDTIQANQCLDLAEMKGSQVRECIVNFTNFIQHVCE